MSKKMWRLALVLLLLLVIPVVRLGWLSLFEAESLAARSLDQHTRTVDYYQYARGDFLDTYGRSFTNNEAACVVVFPTMLREMAETAAQIAEICRLPAQTIQNKLQRAQNQHRAPFCLVADITSAQVEKINAADLPGVFTVTMAPRYSANRPAVHLIGFVGEGENASTYEGKSGLERQYDQVLQGRLSPQVATLVDDRGRELLGQGFRLLPVSGEDPSASVRLTLDIDFQEQVEGALAGYSGAAVVLDVQNGDLLAMASTPSMDPYSLTEAASDDAYLNKALANYPPASTFKIVLTLAALAEGVTTNDDFFCKGFAVLPHGQVIHCWNDKGHGTEDLAHALANSCNPYFAFLGLELGGDKIKEYAAKLGLTEQVLLGYSLKDRTHIEFNNAVPGDVVNASIGENGVRVSPLMIARMLAVCGNGGYLVTPRLVQKVVKADGTVLEQFATVEPQAVVTPQVAEQVKEMLTLTVTEGTAKKAATASISAAAKTGTSQDQGVWFIALAPATKPRWAIVIYLENASAGGSEGAQVFVDIVDALACLANVEDE